MIISVSGYGYSGSGAVVDYLKGFNDTWVEDYVEFQLLHEADGISNLRYFLSESKERIACNAAIHRFIKLQKSGVLARVLRHKYADEFDKITDDFLNSIIQCSWQGQSAFDPIEIDSYSNNNRIRNFQERVEILLRKVNIKYPRYKKRFYSSLNEDEFDRFAKDYIYKILDLMEVPYRTTNCVFDMLFSATNPDEGRQYFDDCRCIVVDRNPVDIWIISKKKDDDYTFMPSNDLKSFVKYYRSMREKQNRSKNALYIKYEDLIYKYDETIEIINKYIGKSARPDNEFKFFDPSVSIKYTNLETKEKVNPDEIEYIKANLAEYLYDFDKYSAKK